MTKKSPLRTLPQEGSSFLVCPLTGYDCYSCTESAIIGTVTELKSLGLNPKRAAILGRGTMKNALAMMEGLKPYWMVERGEMTCSDRREFLVKSATELVISGLPEFIEYPLEIVRRAPTEPAIAVGDSTAAQLTES